MALPYETLPHINPTITIFTQQPAIDGKFEYKSEGNVWALVRDCVRGGYHLCYSNIGGVYYCRVGRAE